MKKPMLIFIFIAVIVYIIFAFSNKDHKTDTVISNEKDNRIIRITDLQKIGIIEVIFDSDNNSHIRKEEVLTEDEQKIKSFVDIVNNGTLHSSYTLNKLATAEYDLMIYYEEKTVKGYFWSSHDKYNLNLKGINGEITVDSAAMLELLKSIINQN